MASKTEIANRAISHLGIGKEIANIDTDKSEEAAACRRFYEVAKKSTLGDLDWTFAGKFAVLNLIEENPTSEWAYSYRYPSDCINFRRILSGSRRDSADVKIPYKILKDNSGLIIYSDQPEAESEYTEDITDPAFFTPEFDLSLSYRLAIYIAPRLTRGDPFKIKNDLYGLYLSELGLAKSKNMNEEVSDPRPDSELITTRS